MVYGGLKQRLLLRGWATVLITNLSAPLNDLHADFYCPQSSLLPGLPAAYCKSYDTAMCASHPLEKRGSVVDAPVSQRLSSIPWFTLNMFSPATEGEAMQWQYIMMPPADRLSIYLCYTYTFWLHCNEQRQPTQQWCNRSINQYKLLTCTVISTSLF